MNTRTLILAAAVGCALTSQASAAFHLMQIEEVIGGVYGNTSAQAIQLRMRSASQNILGSTRLRAWDATGSNPVTIFDFNTSVTNAALGDRILVTSSAFNTLMSGVSGYAADFTMTTPIPLSYYSGGKITFESDSGTSIYWSLAFGSYTGTNLGDGTNDTDFGAPFASALPTATATGILFNGAANTASTTNAAQYILSSNPTTVTNNARGTFTVVPEPGSVAMAATGLIALSGLTFLRRRR